MGRIVFVSFLKHALKTYTHAGGKGRGTIDTAEALAENESAMREMGDEILKSIAIELTKKLRNSVSADWQRRESVRAKMRNMIRIILRRYRYPPDQQMEAIKMVMKQAEVLSDEWSHSEYDTPAKPYVVNNSYDVELMAADDAQREYGG